MKFPNFGLVESMGCDPQNGLFAYTRTDGTLILPSIPIGALLTPLGTVAGVFLAAFKRTVAPPAEFPAFRQLACAVEATRYRLTSPPCPSAFSARTEF